VYTVFSDGSKAFLKYTVENGIMKLLETYTPPQHRGKGVALQLIKYAIELAKRNNWLIEPICSYVIYFFTKNPDYRYILADPYRSLSDEEWKKLFEEAKMREEMKRSEQ
jgi:predicted GNAT family acetyltransferase